MMENAYRREEFVTVSNIAGMVLMKEPAVMILTSSHVLIIQEHGQRDGQHGLIAGDVGIEIIIGVAIMAIVYKNQNFVTVILTVRMVLTSGRDVSWRPAAMTPPSPRRKCTRTGTAGGVRMKKVGGVMMVHVLGSGISVMERMIVLVEKMKPFGVTV